MIRIGRYLAVIILFVLLVSILGYQDSWAQGREPAEPEPVSGGMPGRPVPEKAIPHHGPGKLSNSANYVTQVTRSNDEGLDETVQLRGLDAMAADGVDPFAGNHTLVTWDKLMFGAYQSQNSFGYQTLGYYTDTLEILPDTFLSPGNYQSNDIAAGDLNGDGQAEQIAAWIGLENHLMMSIGEMPGSQKATSVPAAVARGGAPLDGTSLQFDGLDDYVDADDNINLQFSSFTVAFWAKRDNINTDDYVVGQGWSIENAGLHIGFRSNNAFTCAFWANDLDTPAFTGTGWHYWACTYDSSTNRRTIYRDGIQVAQDIATADYQGAGKLYLGRAATGYNFDGLIDEVGIWTVARTPDQIRADLIRSTPDMANVAAYWNFDEGSGPTAVDASGNGHDGTLIDGPVWSLEHAPLGDIHLVVRGYDESLWHCVYDVDNGDCLNWSNAAGGLLASGPAIVSRGTDQFDLFALGTDNLVYQRHWDSAGWSDDWIPEPPDPVSPDLTSSMGPRTQLPEWPAPAAVARGGSQLDLFRLAPDHTLRWRHSADGIAWEAWKNLGGMLASGPGVISLAADHMQLFARGVDEALWTRNYNGDWGPWERIGLDGMDEGVTIASAPAPISPAVDQIVVHVQGSDDQLWSISYSAGVWGTWSTGGSPLTSGLGTALWSGDQHFFTLSTGGQLQHSDDGATWTELSALEPQVTYDTGSVAAAPASPVVIDNFDVDIETGNFLGAGRDQIVAAFRDSSDPDLFHIEVYDARSGFEPLSISRATVSTAAGVARIATGDFDGDGLDEIAVVKLVENIGHWKLEVYDTYDNNKPPNWMDNLRLVYESEHYYTDSQFGHGAMGFLGTLNIASGDFNGDRLEEIVVSSDWGFDCRLGPFPFFDLDCRFYARLDIFDIVDELDKHPFAEVQQTQFYLPVLDPNISPYLTGFTLAAGDVDGDGKDEIVRTWPDGYSAIHGRDWPNLYRRLQVYDASDLSELKEQATLHLGGYSWESWAEKLAIGDLDRDLVDEIAFFHVAGPTEPSLQVHIFEYLPPVEAEDPGSLVLMDRISPDPITFDWLRSTKLVAADYTGEGLRVGPPSFRIQEEMTTPVTFLNLPPVHRDVVCCDDNGGDVVLDLSELEFSATHVDTEINEQKSTSQSHRDWSLSTGIETEVGAGGHSLKTSLENTYAEDFSESHGIINSRSYSDQTIAEASDQIVYNGTSYAIWEYPVLGLLDEGGTAPKTISVVWPLVPTTNQASTRSGNVCSEEFYAPGHQAFNVWSYDPRGASFTDFGEPLVDKLTTGGTVVGMEIGEAYQDGMTSSFTNQINAGLEYSYEYDLDIPLVGNVFDFSFRASVEGSFGFGKISTFETEFTKQSRVEIAIPTLPGDMLYETQAFLYLAKGGYLVVDYQTNPDLGGATWALYDKPDPAFTLSWYGFPDPEDPIVPPCGRAKQLFSHDIVVEPRYAGIGDEVTIRATIRNFSGVRADNVFVDFRLGDPETGKLLNSSPVKIDSLLRSAIDYPKTVEITWTVEPGTSGEQKIYAIIDPQNNIDEEHDEDEVIDNNIAYGLLQVADADYVDPGLKEKQAFQLISLDLDSDLNLNAFIPTANYSETRRHELLTTPIDGIAAIGEPFRLDVYAGGEDVPILEHLLQPVPAGISIQYGNDDIKGMDEEQITLYRQNNNEWVVAACEDTQPIRFPDDNFVLVPVCKTGTYVFSDGPPNTMVYLPMIYRSTP